MLSLAVTPEDKGRLMDGVGSPVSVVKPEAPMASGVVKSSREEGAPAEESARPETSGTAKAESGGDALGGVTETDVEAVALRLFSAVVDGMPMLTCSTLLAPVRADGPLEETVEAFEMLCGTEVGREAGSPTKMLVAAARSCQQSHPGPADEQLLTSNGRAQSETNLRQSQGLKSREEQAEEEHLAVNSKS